MAEYTVYSLEQAQKLIANHYMAATFQPAAQSYTLTTPIDGSEVLSIADCRAEEAKTSIDTAWTAFESWRDSSAFDRSALLEKWYGAMLANQETLAQLMTLEMGKPITESRGEVAYAAGYVKWYAEEAKRVYGTHFPAHHAAKRLLALRQPVGPCYAITPWNFPAAMLTRKAAPALAAGCTFIAKPAEKTPLTALLLGRLWLDVGAPEGTLQILTSSSSRQVSAPYFEDGRIRKITFTGSTPVGKILYKQSADTVKKLSLELGGHAPFIIFEDADVAQAVDAVIACKFRNSGQTCICTNRIYVHESLVDTFATAFSAKVSQLKLGDPRQDDCQIGPLVDQAGVAKVQEHVEDAVSKGAKVLTGGTLDHNLYYPATVLSNVSNDMLIMHEETFGPVAPITSFRDEADVVRMANDTQYGLASYFFTKDLARAWRVAEKLEYGIVGVNDGAPSAPYAPFGGLKESGIGREGGSWGMDEYLVTKYVSMNLAE